MCIIWKATIWYSYYTIDDRVDVSINLIQEQQYPNRLEIKAMN